jgi:geranylgeranyl pyrophosphate synthase
LDLATILQPIHEELGLVEQKIQTAIEVEYSPLSEAFKRLLRSGGKRIRPAIVLLAAKSRPCDLSKVLVLATAVELLHNATLVHDDMIDDAKSRRGNPTLNTTWSPGATVLAGDYLFARAAYVAAETENIRAVRIFANTLMAICEGELQQSFGAFSLQQTKDDYYRRIYAKTASLFAASTEAAGVLSHAPEEHIQRLRDYGHDLGMAFQIVDDVLDFVGDEREVGKPLGTDLRQGVITLPVYYFAADHPAHAEQVAALANRDDEREEAIASIVSAIRASSAIEASLAEARDFAMRAAAALALLPDDMYRQSMRDLATYVVERRK